MDPRHGAIGISDGASDASMLEGLLVELNNMTKAKELVELQFKRIKEMKRDEYIEAMERLEFKRRRMLRGFGSLSPKTSGRTRPECRRIRIQATF